MNWARLVVDPAVQTLVGSDNGRRKKVVPPEGSSAHAELINALLSIALLHVAVQLAFVTVAAVKGAVM